MLCLEWQQSTLHLPFLTDSLTSQKNQSQPSKWLTRYNGGGAQNIPTSVPYFQIIIVQLLYICNITIISCPFCYNSKVLSFYLQKSLHDKWFHHYTAGMMVFCSKYQKSLLKFLSLYKRKCCNLNVSIFQNKSQFLQFYCIQMSFHMWMLFLLS